MSVSYISGWQALNIPNENGLIADWHPLLYFKDNKPTKLYEILNNPLKELGIKKRNIKTLSKEYKIASFARAIADLVYANETKELKNCVKDFLSDDDEKELFKYLKILLENSQIDDKEKIENFMKFELTKLYFGEKNA